MKKKSFNDFISKLQTLKKTKHSLSKELRTLGKEFFIFEKEAEEGAKKVVSKHNKEVANYEKMLKMAKDGGIPTADIDKKIQVLRSEKESNDKKSKKLYEKTSSKFKTTKNKLSKKIEKIEKEIKNQVDFIQIQEYAKNILEITDYYEVKNLKEIFKMLEIKIVPDGLNGDIKKVSINGGSFEIELSVEASSKKCLTTYLPPQIEWLPDDWADIEREGVEITRYNIGRPEYDSKILSCHKTISPTEEFTDEEFPQLFFDTSKQKFVLLQDEAVIRPVAVIKANTTIATRPNVIHYSYKEEDVLEQETKNLAKTTRIELRISNNSERNRFGRIEEKILELDNELITKYKEKCLKYLSEFLFNGDYSIINKDSDKNHHHRHLKTIDSDKELNIRLDIEQVVPGGERIHPFPNSRKSAQLKTPKLVESIPAFKFFDGKFCNDLKEPTVFERWNSEIVKKENVLDLDQEYSEGGLLKYIKDLVINNTVLGSDSPFDESDDSHLPSQKIFLKFEKNWNKFVKGPWVPEMEGILANLKHYCEKRDIPSFYNNGLKNSYGFRLRTRDHSWIKGTIYLLPEEKDDSDTIEVRKDSDGYKFKIGRMCVFLSGETRDYDKKGR